MITLGAGNAPASLSLLSLGTLLGWPVLAEPLSGLRLDAGRAGRALAAGQLLIGDEAWLASHPPEVVLQVGATPTTRATQWLVARADALVVLDRDHLNPDPDGRAERRIAVEPELFAALAWDDREALSIEAADGRWTEVWREADLLARHAADLLLDAWDEPFEGRVARDVASFLPHGATLVVGSSTPVRDLDVFMAPRRPPRIWTAPDLLRVVGNRGASGIDGLVATTLGVAAGSPGRDVRTPRRSVVPIRRELVPVVRRLGLDAVFVVLANGGGQIFSMLDQASLPEHESLFTTPHPGIDRPAVRGGIGGARSDRARRTTWCPRWSGRPETAASRSSRSRSTPSATVCDERSSARRSPPPSPVADQPDGHLVRRPVAADVQDEAPVVVR